LTNNINFEHDDLRYYFGTRAITLLGPFAEAKKERNNNKYEKYIKILFENRTELRKI
jgi:hypothetical protein